jgi:hypothetical protein
MRFPWSLVMFWMGIALAFSTLGFNLLIHGSAKSKAIIFALGTCGLLVLIARFYIDRKSSHDLRNKVEYSEVARLDVFGTTGAAGPGLLERSPIKDIIGAYVHTDGGQLRWECSTDAIDAFSLAMARNSKFPFPYYYRGSCLRAAQKVEWRADITKALEILEITTQIPGHHVNHEEVLTMILSDANLKP